MPSDYTSKGNPIPATSGIYKITCVSTGKIYIGSAVNMMRRRNRHFNDLRNGTHDNIKLRRAFLKYTESAFVFEVQEYVLLPEMLTAREQYWLDTLQPWFNIARIAGSNLGVKYTPEAVEKSRVARTGRKRTPEQCENIGAPRRGKPSSKRGSKATPETIEKLRLSHLGKKQSAETISKRTAGLKGRKRSPEAIEKTRQANTGRKNSPESIARMRAARKGQKGSPEAHANQMKTYILTSPDGTEYTATGIQQFCRTHDLNASNLIQVAKGTVRQSNGWTARYA